VYLQEIFTLKMYAVRSQSSAVLLKTLLLTGT